MCSTLQTDCIHSCPSAQTSEGVRGAGRGVISRAFSGPLSYPPQCWLQWQNRLKGLCAWFAGSTFQAWERKKGDTLLTRMVNKRRRGGVRQVPSWNISTCPSGAGDSRSSASCINKARITHEPFPCQPMLIKENSYSSAKAPLILPSSVTPSLTAREVACPSTVIPHPL